MITPEKPFFYSAVFLSEAERQKLLAAFPPRHKNVYAEHLTISYPADPATVSLGELVSLEIIGVAEDDRGQAVVVKTNVSQNAHPHITISTAEDIPAVYSNELIERGFQPLETPITIEGVIGVSNGSRVIIKKPELAYTHIAMPPRPQPDTIISVFILKKFGEFYFPGIGGAAYLPLQTFPENETPESLESKGVFLLDVGGGTFDHHNKDPQTTAANLITEYMNIKRNPSLAKLLAYVERDDFYGKGTVSDDALDRAFGLSGLIAALNKAHASNQTHVIDSILPLIEGHYIEEVRRNEEMPREVKEKMETGKAEVFAVKQRGKKLNVIIIESENPSLPGFLRSQLGGKYDVVAQIQPTGHTNILTRPAKRIDLRSLVLILRSEEAQANTISIQDDIRLLTKEGRLPELPHWYYDPATNSIQNGGLNPKNVPATKIERFVLRKLLEVGLSEQLWSPVPQDRRGPRNDHGNRNDSRPTRPTQN